jgi:hypothetical protein
MPLDDAFQSGTEAVLADMVQRPQAPRQQPPRFSLWGTITAAPKGARAGVAEAVASTADVLGAFGSVLGATEASAGGMFSLQSEAEAKQAQEARDKLLKSGPDYMSEGGRSFRNAARDFLPDPVSAHGAEVAVSELFRVGAKALTAGAVIGPVPGAIASGLEEGFTASDKLAQQGVDVETRSKVGAVTAAVQAVTFGLPVVGKTMPETIALALGGGPVAFVVQQAATREILRSQDYTKLAEQYDPFDPVGLTLSTLIPLGFGAIAMYASRAAKSAEPLPPPAEAVDAARTALLSEGVTTSRPVPADDMAGSAQHAQAYETALDQMSVGRRVDVTDAAPLAGAERIRGEMEARLAAVAKELPEQNTAVRSADPAPTAIEPVAESAPAAPMDAGPEAVRIPTESVELDARTAQLEAANPQLMVQLEGMDAPAPLSEVMARVRQEAAQEMRDAPLLRTAAECFLATL